MHGTCEKSYLCVHIFLFVIINIYFFLSVAAFALPETAIKWGLRCVRDTFPHSWDGGPGELSQYSDKNK